MDWAKVRFPEKFATKRYQIGELSTLDHAKLLVHSYLVKRSIAEVLKTAAYTFLSRNWEKSMENRLSAEASRLGLTPEELFSRIINDEDIEGGEGVI